MRSEIEFNVSRQFLGTILMMKHEKSCFRTFLLGKKIECLAHEETLSADSQDQKLSFLTGDVQIDVNLGPSNTSLHVDQEMITEVFIKCAKLYIKTL